MIIKNYDIIVLGAGIAGLAFAKYAGEGNPDLNITILSKGEIEHCNTALAQGGMAVVTDFKNDSFENHIEDTIKAGKNGDKEVIQRVVCDAPSRLDDLLRWGVRFDSHQGKLQLHREGGHAMHRIVHHLDKSGKAIHQTLLAQVRNSKGTIEVVEHTMGLDLLCLNNRCHGVYALNEKNEPMLYRANKVVLCGGGSGALFKRTTNNSGACGDAVALAYRKGARIKNFHKVQFHPTALYLKGKRQLPLISEAVRGFGAYLLNHQGQRFAFKYHEKGELATRDVLSAAINQEMNANHSDHLFLSIQHLNKQYVKEAFPNIINTCLKNGIDPFENDIPIVPAAHYQCGGIDVDPRGNTSIENLYAIGECAHTGMHGENRLASNSLLEAMAYAKYAAMSIVNQSEYEIAQENLTKYNGHGLQFSLNGEQLIHRLQDLMTQVFSFRNDEQLLSHYEANIKSLRQSHHYLSLIPNQMAQEIRNRLDLANLFIEEWQLELKEKESVELLTKS